MIQLHTERTNATIHRATLDAPTIERLLTEAVARAASVTLDAPGVRVTKLFHRNEVQDGRGLRPTAVIEIVVDHTAKADEPLASAEEWIDVRHVELKEQGT